MDGGGVKGIIQPTIIKKIEKDFPNFISQFDMFAGTSAGSFNAIAYALGVPTEDLLELWKENIAKVFHESVIQVIESFGNATSCKYRNDALKHMLEQKFSGTLRDLKKKLLVPAFCVNFAAYYEEEEKRHRKMETEPNVVEKELKSQAQENNHGAEESPILMPQKLTNFLSGEGKYAPNTEEIKSKALPLHRNWGPVIFHNFTESRMLSTNLIDIALRSSAAPTYFPIYQSFIDGAVFANNPSMLALSQVLQSGVPLEDIYMISISTGHSHEMIPSAKLANPNWGFLDWAPWIVELLMDSSECSQTDTVKLLLKERYFRIDPFFGRLIKLDNAESVPVLQKTSEDLDLSDLYVWLSRYLDLNPVTSAPNSRPPSPVQDSLADSSTYVKLPYPSPTLPETATQSSHCTIF